MDDITVEHQASPMKLDILGVYDWPVWSKEISTFAWTYDTNETCYFLEGEATVTPEHGTAVTLTEGDLIKFPKGMKCTWQIHLAVRKHYDFS